MMRMMIYLTSNFGGRGRCLGEGGRGWTGISIVRSEKWMSVRSDWNGTKWHGFLCKAEILLPENCYNGMIYKERPLAAASFSAFLLALSSCLIVLKSTGFSIPNSLLNSATSLSNCSSQ